MLKQRPKRSVLFVFWGAEEKGLLGSEHWIENPTVPRKKVRLMLNLDMVGRMRQGKVEVHGSRGAYGLRQFISRHSDNDKLKFDFLWKLPRESDHYAFLKVGVPAIMLHTGKHGDYHRPSDDAHKLNVAGLQAMTRLTFRLARAAADSERLPTFRAACFAEDDNDRKRKFAALGPLPLRLGASWDPERAKRGDLRVTSVTAGAAAQRAGLRPGDRILRFA